MAFPGAKTGPTVTRLPGLREVATIARPVTTPIPVVRWTNLPTEKASRSPATAFRATVAPVMATVPARMTRAREGSREGSR